MPSRVELDPTAYAAYSSAMWGDLPRTEAAVRSMRPESRRAAQLACALLFHMVERIEDEEPPR